MKVIEKIFLLDILSKGADDEHIISRLMELNNCSRDVAEAKLQRMKNEKEEN